MSKLSDFKPELWVLISLADLEDEALLEADNNNNNNNNTNEPPKKRRKVNNNKEDNEEDNKEEFDISYWEKLRDEPDPYTRIDRWNKQRKIEGVYYQYMLFEGVDFYKKVTMDAKMTDSFKYILKQLYDLYLKDKNRDVWIKKYEYNQFLVDLGQTPRLDESKETISFEQFLALLHTVAVNTLNFSRNMINLLKKYELIKAFLQRIKDNDPDTRPYFTANEIEEYMKSNYQGSVQSFAANSTKKRKYTVDSAIFSAKASEYGNLIQNFGALVLGIFHLGVLEASEYRLTKRGRAIAEIFRIQLNEIENELPDWSIDDEADIRQSSLDLLKKYCFYYGLNHRGKKSVIIRTILKYLKEGTRDLIYKKGTRKKQKDLLWRTQRSLAISRFWKLYG